MAYLGKQGGRVDYKYKEYFIDDPAELQSINVEDCSPGSVAYVMTTGDIYMLTNQKEWRLQ